MVAIRLHADQPPPDFVRRYTLKPCSLLALSVQCRFTVLPETDALRPDGAAGGVLFGLMILTITVSVAVRPTLSVMLACTVREPVSVAQSKIFEMLPPVPVAGLPGPDH